MLKIKLLSFIAIFSLCMNFWALQAMGSIKEKSLEKIDKPTVEAGKVDTETDEIIWNGLEAAAALEKEKAGGSDNLHLEMAFLRQFSSAVVKKYIESLVLRREKKELHTLFQFNDLDLPIELAGFAQSIHDEALVDACAFAFATTFVQPALCQNVDGVGLIKKIRALGANFEEFKKKAAIYVRQRMGYPLRVLEYEGEEPSFAKFSPDDSVVVLDKGSTGITCPRSIVIVSALSGKVLYEFNFSASRRPIITFTRNSNILTCCFSEPQMIYIWDLNSGKLLYSLRPEEMFPSEKVEIVDIKNSQSGNRLIIEMRITKETEGEKSVDSKICLWDLTSNRSLGLFRGYHYGNNRIIYGYNRACNVCVISGHPGEYTAFDTETGSAVPIYLPDSEEDRYVDCEIHEEKILYRKTYRYPGDFENEKKYYFEIRGKTQKTLLGYVENKHGNFRGGL